MYFLEFSFEMGDLSNLSSLIFCQKLLKINYLLHQSNQKEKQEYKFTWSFPTLL